MCKRDLQSSTETYYHQKRPTSLSDATSEREYAYDDIKETYYRGDIKETYYRGKKDLLRRQKRPTSLSDATSAEKRESTHMLTSKENYYRGKRDLL